MLLLRRVDPGIRHLAAEPEQYGFRLPHDRFCSGALLATAALFRASNGYSNGYWGWGGEDDDFCLRAVRRVMPWTSWLSCCVAHM